MEHLWGIDLGGTKIEGVVMEAAPPFRAIERMRLPTEQEQGYEHIMHQIGRLVRQMEAQTGLHAGRIGVGTPGTLDPETQTLKNSNTTCLNGQPFRSDLEAHLQLPVVTANDANCFAAAEANMGVVAQQGIPARVVFGSIMGTGVGGGIVVDGRVLNGRHGIAGEWGHNFLDAEGGRCYCGKAGCVETLISGPALEYDYQQRAGRFLRMPEIVQRAYEGEGAAKETMDRLLYFFGKAIAQVVNILDPDAIVLGGGLGNIDLLYERGREAILPHLFNDAFTTPLLRPILGDSAGVFGAAQLSRFGPDTE